MVQLDAPAKINLFLRILAQERSGYHQLETCFSAVEFGDRLTLEATDKGIFLEIEGIPCGPVEENLAYRAAEVFLSRERGTGGVGIRIEKRIPVGAGLGGGSSDCASTLLGLQSLYPGVWEEEELFRMAGTLGSDVPFFLSSFPLALAWGRGDRLLPLSPPPPAPVLLALPPVRIATREAYRSLAEARRAEAWSPGATRHDLGSFSGWEGFGGIAANDFEAEVFRAHPLLASMRDAIRDTGPVIALLSGSGAALFGLFADEEKALEARFHLSSLFPESRFVLTRTRSDSLGPAPG